MGKRVPPEDTTEILQLIIDDPALWDALFPRESFLGPKSNKQRMPQWRATQSLTISVYSKKQGWTEEYRKAGLVEVREDGRVIPTERWTGEYGDPVRYHLATLKGWMKKGKFLKEYAVDPAWTTWNQTSKAARSVLQAEYPFYLLLHKLWSTPAAEQSMANTRQKKRDLDALSELIGSEGRRESTDPVVVAHEPKKRRVTMPTSPPLRIDYAIHDADSSANSDLSDTPIRRNTASRSTITPKRKAGRDKRAEDYVGHQPRICASSTVPSTVDLPREPKQTMNQRREGKFSKPSAIPSPHAEMLAHSRSEASSPGRESEVDAANSGVDADHCNSSNSEGDDSGDDSDSDDSGDSDAEFAPDDDEGPIEESSVEGSTTSSASIARLSATQRCRLLHRLVSDGHPQRLPPGHQAEAILHSLRSASDISHHFTAEVASSVRAGDLSAEEAIAVTSVRLMIGAYTRQTSLRRYRVDALSNVRFQLVDVRGIDVTSPWIMRIMSLIQSCGGVVCRSQTTLLHGSKTEKRILMGMRSAITPEHVTPTKVGGRTAMKLSMLMLLRWIDKIHYLRMEPEGLQQRRYDVGRGEIAASLAMTDAEWFAYNRNGSLRWVQRLAGQATRMRLLVDAMNFEMATRSDRPAKRLAIIVQDTCREAEHFDATMSKKVLALAIRAGAKICTDFAELSARSKCLRVEVHSFTLPKSPVTQAWKGVSYVNENLLDVLLRLDGLINTKRS